MELLLLTLFNEDEASPRDVVVTIRVVVVVIGEEGDVRTNASVINILLGPRIKRPVSWGQSSVLERCLGLVFVWGLEVMLALELMLKW
jgi:hypothetical protein